MLTRLLGERRKAMKALREFCHWHRLSYPMTQLQADLVFAELDSAMATENVMEDGELSAEEGE